MKWKDSKDESDSYHPFVRRSIGQKDTCDRVGDTRSLRKPRVVTVGSTPIALGPLFRVVGWYGSFSTRPRLVQPFSGSLSVRCTNPLESETESGSLPRSESDVAPTRRNRNGHPTSRRTRLVGPQKTRRNLMYKEGIKGLSWCSAGTQFEDLLPCPS